MVRTRVNVRRDTCCLPTNEHATVSYVMSHSIVLTVFYAATFTQHTVYSWSECCSVCALSCHRRIYSVSVKSRINLKKKSALDDREFLVMFSDDIASNLIPILSSSGCLTNVAYICPCSYNNHLYCQAISLTSGRFHRVVKESAISPPS